ncbi:Centrosomal protein of 41 kDa [Phytophthora pseudosyringae]|uniref:Centrosomal protein of 41 kDa n=1 Tax=Phytophthora pseudosyringae TaxID=221518 RepID=A0A8T1VEE2_9STRA|nr:Centrosomal protein of 41 kDa [Phytophthora pseudosyringae]
MARAKATDVVQLSCCGFALWWVLFLAVHAVISVYNAVFAYSYSILHDAYLEVLLEAFYIGMPPSSHHWIVIVHATMSGLHAVCILLMVGGSIWQRSLAFTPWSTRTAGPTASQIKPAPSNSTIFQKICAKITDRHGIFGVNGIHFHEMQLYRKLVETSLQTIQAYRMSKFLPRTILNRFYVVLLAFNCWSPLFANSCFFKGNEARRRFASIALDCVIDLVACIGVQVIVVLSYASDFDRNLDVLSYLTLFNNEWMARAYNEFQIVVVVSWWDLASRAFFSLGLLAATTNMKELLQRQPPNRNRVAQSSAFSAVPVEHTKKATQSGINLHTRAKNTIMRTVHFLVGIWGALVLAFHINASTQPTLPQCLMQVRPWAASRPSCYLIGLDCDTLNISGSKDQVDAMWSEFDSSTVVQLLIRHCPTLEVPVRFTEFHGLRGIKVYNTTINEWGESAAITSTNHPKMSGLYMIRVNMTDGLLPAGFQSTDFPPLLYDIEFCVTNLRELPDDLDTKWLPESVLEFEFGQLTHVPPVVIRLQPFYLALTGNPMTALPPDIFEVDGMYLLGISHMNIHELPHNVSKASETLLWIFMRDTDISFFWAWADELVERMQSQGQTAPWIAGFSSYCNDLAEIQNGSADGFRVPLSSEYSQTLMDSSEENLQVISKAVNCKATTGLPSGGGMFHPLAYEDSINAISFPPPVARQV